MAAWWLDDAPTIFESREQAYRLYRERQDKLGAARMASFLAMDYQLLRGEPAVSQGWFQRAYRLLEGMGPTFEHGFLAIQEAVGAIDVQRDSAAARRAGARVIEVGRALDSVDLEMTGLAIEGVALVSEGRVDEGMLRLDEATAAATSEMEDPLLIGLTSCYMMFACERVRDLDRAAQWCERVKEFSRRVGLKLLLNVCKAHYGSILTSRGEWNEAEEELVPVVEDMFETFPGIAHDGVIRLAELRRRQGRLEEATQLFTLAEYHPYGQLGQAEIAFDRGDFAAATSRAGSFVRNINKENVTERAAGYEVLIRAHVALGQVNQAHRALQQLKEVAEEIGTPLLKAAADAGEGIILAASGESERARLLLEDSIGTYVRENAPYDAAVARLELARCLHALANDDQAATEAEQAREVLIEMGASRLAEQAASLSKEITSPPPSKQAGPLSMRETEVLKLVAEGLSNQEVADRLVLSEHTVHRHVANILTKLQVKTRSAAAAKATREGIL